MLARHVGKRDQANLALGAQIGQLLDRFIEGSNRSGRVQLVDVDAVEAQPLQAAFDRVAQMFGLAS